MLELIFVLSVFMVFYAYFGYPLLLLLLVNTKRRISSGVLASFNPTVTIVIAARNEEQVIAEKLENTLGLLWGEGKTVESAPELQVIVASDCSEDKTDSIVRLHAARKVELVRATERRGKEHVQALAVDASRGDILVFTDAKTTLRSDALKNLVKYFADPGIGAISSLDEVDFGAGIGEGAYVRYEMWVRELESSFYSLVGLSGSCFAVRRNLCRDFRRDIPSDFSVLLSVVKNGFRGVLAGDVLCSYKSTTNPAEEFRRKVRTILRGMTTLHSCKEVLNVFVYGAFSWQVFSHKLCRWLVPFFVILAAFCLLILSFSSMFYMSILMFSLGTLLLAAGGYFSEHLRKEMFCKIPLFFIISNLAILVAAWHFALGKRSIMWTPSLRMFALALLATIFP
ncbi:MAG: glycosyltransferase family 2 protein [Deltaproteobacteria bacterium]|nr:glycosyltransferase family 2 protein [Deltaproteobacteria bacterium]